MSWHHMLSKEMTARQKLKLYLIRKELNKESD